MHVIKRDQPRRRFRQAKKRVCGGAAMLGGMSIVISDRTVAGGNKIGIGVDAGFGKCGTITLKAVASRQRGRRLREKGSPPTVQGVRLPVQSPSSNDVQPNLADSAVARSPLQSD